jgi:hypothetical protein
MKMPGGNDIERLYDEHAQPLYAFLLNFTRDEADTRRNSFLLCRTISSPASLTSIAAPRMGNSFSIQSAGMKRMTTERPVKLYSMRKKATGSGAIRKQNKEILNSSQFGAITAGQRD